MEEFNKEERDILEDLIVVIAAMFEKETSQVKKSLMQLGTFDDLIGCLLCSHTLKVPLHKVVEQREKFDGEIIQEKSKYNTLPKDWN